MAQIGGQGKTGIARGLAKSLPSRSNAKSAPAIAVDSLALGRCADNAHLALKATKRKRATIECSA
jgi:hypothetical protein